MNLKQSVVVLLRGAVLRRQVPGVVAMATDREGTVYDAPLASVCSVVGRPSTTDTVGWSPR